MKNFPALFFACFLMCFNVNAQTVIFSEDFTDFDTCDAAELAGPCDTDDITACGTYSPQAGDGWFLSAAGDITTLTASGDNAETQSSGVLEFQDAEAILCFNTPILTLGGATTISISVDVIESGDLEPEDFVDINLIADGVASTLTGGEFSDGVHTLVGDLPDAGDWSTSSLIPATVTGSIAASSTFQLQICVLNNAGSEQISLDNIAVTDESGISPVYNAPEPCGEPVADPCANAGGDADADGVCADLDCDDSDASVGAIADGTTCDDGDDNTENDIYTACVCSGTPISPVDPTCDDGMMNGDETGVDCGGSCEPCETEPTPTCDDGMMNGDETGIDCGGSCDPCDVEPPVGDDVPTMGEWGLIILALLTLNFTMLYSVAGQTQLANGSTVRFEWKNVNAYPFNKEIFVHAAMLTAVLLAFTTIYALAFYGFLTVVDVVGCAIAAPIFTYMIHLIVLLNQKEQ